MSQLDWESLVAVGLTIGQLVLIPLAIVGFIRSVLRSMRSGKLAVWVPRRRTLIVLVIFFVLDGVAISGGLLMAKRMGGEPVRYAIAMQAVWPTSDQKYPPMVQDPSPQSYSILREYFEAGVQCPDGVLTDSFSLHPLDVPPENGIHSMYFNVGGVVPTGSFAGQIGMSPDLRFIVVVWFEEFGNFAIDARSIEDFEPYFSLIVCRVAAADRLDQYLKSERPDGTNAGSEKLADFHSAVRSSLPERVDATEFDWDTASRQVAEAYDTYIAGVLPESAQR